MSRSRVTYCYVQWYIGNYIIYGLSLKCYCIVYTVFYIFGSYCLLSLLSVSILCAEYYEHSFIYSPLAKKELNKLCTLPLNGWLGADNSNVGGSDHRDLYCLGRRVAGLLGAGLDLWTVIGHNIKRSCHLSNVCVSRSKYNSTFTHELCLLCGRHYLCGDVVPLRSPVPAEGKNSCEDTVLVILLICACGGLVDWSLALYYFHYHCYVDRSVCWTDYITIVTVFSLALFMLV